MRRPIIFRKSQCGAASLLFILLVAVAFMAASASALMGAGGAQKIQYAEHVATQAEMSAYAGVSVLSAAIAALPSTAVLTPNGIITLTGTQAGISAKYVGLTNGFLVFQVTGSSAGAKSVMQVAYRLPASSSTAASGDVTVPKGVTLHGNTTFGGSINYAGSALQSVSVFGGSLTMTGSVTGLETVCATGDVIIASAIQVNRVCSNGSVELKGGASVPIIDAVGNVTISGGGSSALGTINSNGAVALTGGSATAGTVNATGNVTVSGGSAKATTINTQGNIDWTSTVAGGALNANGTVNYRPSANPAATNITAIGDVTVTSAKDVKTSGKTTLVGYYGQGVIGVLNGQGLLSGSSWGANGGAVVNSGTVGSVTTPFPSSVKVTVAAGYKVSIAALQVASVAVFADTPIVVDAYALKTAANFVFTGVDSSGNPIVKVSSINGVSDGTYFIANKQGGGSNYLCASVTGTTCTSIPVTKMCQGYSDSNPCFAFASGAWSVNGKTMLPSVAWFQGDLTVGNGVWVNTFVASGNITTSGSTVVYAPNYPTSAYSCTGAADTTHSLTALSSFGLSGANYATQICGGSAKALSGAPVANIALLAGGYSGGVFAGGNITLGTSNMIYGAVMAGQFLSTSGSTSVAGTLYSAAQGGTATGGNAQGGSTTIIDSNGSSAYQPSTAPCMKNCTTAAPAPPANNIIWVGPV